MKIQYRPEIDGLRAVSVLAVILFHAEFVFYGTGVLEGGFLGVDIFFVISGYLISSIILTGLKEKTFSFAHFYERRIRRILPILFLVILVTSLFAWENFAPNALLEYSKSAISAIFFASNIYFWMEDGYWAEASELKPLLHTWSLSVEEQFYLVIPAVLLFIWHFLRSYLVAIVLLGLFLSLILSDVLATHYGELAFFMLPTRAWELLAGVVLGAYEVNRGRHPKGWTTQVLPSLGMVLIAASFVMFSEHTKHPSFLTAIPVVGTMLVIWYGGFGDHLTKLLKTGPFVALGRLSYGFYLWHIPVFVFARLQVSEPTTLDKMGWIALSLLITTLTYFLVEKPFRNPDIVRTRYLTAGLVTTFCLAMSLSSFALLNDGISIANASARDLFRQTERLSLEQDGAPCHARDLENFCRFGEPSRPITLINAGDSHSDILSVPLQRLAEDHGLQYTQMTSPACPLAINYETRYNGDLFVGCNEAYNQRRLEIIQHTPNAIVVYGGRLPKYLSNFGDFDNGVGGIEKGFSGFDLHLVDEMRSFEEGVLETLKIIQQHAETLVLIYPNPVAGAHVQRVIHSMPRVNGAADPTYQYKFSKGRYLEFAESARALYDSIKGDNIIRIYPDEIMCDGAYCFVVHKGKAYYHDTNHPSSWVAEEIAKRTIGALVERGDLDRKIAKTD